MDASWLSRALAMALDVPWDSIQSSLRQTVVTPPPYVSDVPGFSFQLVIRWIVDIGQCSHVGAAKFGSMLSSPFRRLYFRRHRSNALSMCPLSSLMCKQYDLRLRLVTERRIRQMNCNLPDMFRDDPRRLWPLL